MNPLHDIAQRMMAPGKGLLAADESISTAGKRLTSVGVESTEETRRQYRDLFLSADGIEKYLSGVILFEETLGQKANDGAPFPELLEKKGVIPGIKVDQGAKDSVDFPGEQITEGLDGLEDRLKGYYDQGARFAKWRAVVTIGEGLPSDKALAENMSRMARYAKRCQEAGIVPIVEPEVLLDGTHTMERSAEVHEKTFKMLFEALASEGVDLKGCVLKASMVVPGSESGETATPEEVAAATVKALVENVPPELAGVVFLSGGQTAVGATENLDKIAELGPHPWPVSFSYARALQGPALEVWRGDASKVEEARKVFLDRLEKDSAATTGAYEHE